MKCALTLISPLILALASGTLALAAELDPAFLSLPAHDVERAENASAPVRIGDRLMLKAVGLGQSVQPVPPEGEQALREQGWAVFPLKGSVNQADAGFVAVPVKQGKLTLPSIGLAPAGAQAEQASSAATPTPQPSPAGLSALARTNPFTVEVLPATDPQAGQEEKPPELLGPVGLAFPWWAAALAALFALALLAGAVYALIRYSRSRRPPAPVEPEKPRPPEDEEALAALLALEKQGFAMRGEFKKHYFGVSEILKTYVGRRYRFDAPECTSREIIQSLEARQSVEDRVIDRLETLLGRLDLVKFTDHVPDSAEPALVVEDARTLVRETRRRFEPASGPSQGGPSAPGGGAAK